MHNRILIAGMSLSFAAACSASSGPNAGGSLGGSTNGSNVGGAIGSGGDTAAASSAAGGTPGAGGAVMSGGANTGGAVATGGASTSTSAPTGGKTSSAGSAATGGKATGGQPALGGATGAGGKASTGGAAPTGGAASAGGAAPTGGKASTGGVAATGGKASTGGAATAGGSTGIGGKSSVATGGKANTGGTTATSSTGCTREMLQAAVDQYMTAIQAGDSSGVASASYKENGSTVALGSGLWATPLVVDVLPPLTALDVDQCQAYVEVIVNNNHKYVFAARLSVTASSGQLSAISVIATDCDDWGFNAATYLQYSKQEQQSGGWGDVPAADQLARADLQDAGYKYFAYWGDKTVQVPWGTPCSRLEGGAYTGANGTCSVGIPDQDFAPQPTGALIDVDRGMAVIFVNLPGPDSHWFRVNKSGIRYIHTLTVCYVNGAWQCPGTQPTCS